MNSPEHSAEPVPSGPGTALDTHRVVPLAVLLVAEVLLFRRLFTTDTLVGAEVPWAAAIRLTRFTVPWGLWVLGSFLLIGGRAFRAHVRELMSTSAGYRPWPQALLHPAALLGFFWITSRILAHDGQRDASWVLAILWPLAGVLVVFSLIWIAFPLGGLKRFLVGTSWPFVAAPIVGTFAFVAGVYVSETWPFWRPLNAGTLWLSNALLGLVVDERVFVPARQLLGTPEFRVVITKYCSGYEGLSLFFVFYLVFLSLWRHRLRFPNALLLLPLGMTAVWILNSIRIVILLLLGTHISQEVALDGFHVNAGWPSICLVSFSIVAVSTRVGFFASRPISSSTQDTVNPTAAYLAPLLVIVLTSMVAGAFTAIPESMYPVQMLAGATVLWIYRKEVDLRPGWSWAAALIGAAACVIWIGLHFVFGAGDEDPIAWQESRSAFSLTPWWIARILGSVAVVPLAEELAFRGFLLRRLVASDFESVRYGRFRWVPFLVSSLVFGALHQAWVAGTVVGLLYALAAYRRERLFDAVLAHAVTNGLLVVFAATTGNWGIL